MLKTQFSIRYKYLLVTSFLLVFTLGVLVFLALQIFKEDKTQLVFDYSRSSVTNIASEMNSLFKNVYDKMELASFLLDEREASSKIKKLFNNEKDLAYFGMLKSGQRYDFYRNSEFDEIYSLKKDFYKTQLERSKKIPLDKINKNSGAIWNATVSEGAPLVGMARQVLLFKGNKARKIIFISYLKGDRLIKALSRGFLNEVYIVNRFGETIAHSDISKLFKSEMASEDKVFKKAKDLDVDTSVFQIEQNGQTYLSAFSKSFNGEIFVLSNIPHKKAFSAVDRLLYRSIVFALIMLTIAFIAAVIFSKSLLKPIQLLVEGMRRVSGGALDVSINVKSNDELELLAKSFNSMILDLKYSREELEKTNKDLEIKVKERTVELEKQNIAVKEAQEALIRTTRLAAVGEISGRAAHEVLNPLTSIVSRIQKVKKRVQKTSKSEAELFSEICGAWEGEYKKEGLGGLQKMWSEKSSVNSEESMWEEDYRNINEINKNYSTELTSVMEDADFLLKESHRIDRIIQSMRKLNTVKSDKKVLEIQSLVENATHIMADLADQNSIKLTTHFNEKVNQCGVSLDKDEFIQALTNLLRNSIQSLRDSNVEKKYVLVDVEATQNNVFIRVIDNGTGISAENKEKLFDKQFTTKPADEGTGLGLSISRRFIRGFDGELSLDQSDSNRTIFLIKLPKFINKIKDVA